MTIRPDTHIHIPGKTAVLDTKFAAESDPNVRFVNRRPYLAHPVPTCPAKESFRLENKKEKKLSLPSLSMG